MKRPDKIAKALAEFFGDMMIAPLIAMGRFEKPLVRAGFVLMQLTIYLPIALLAMIPLGICGFSWMLLDVIYDVPVDRRKAGKL